MNSNYFLKIKKIADNKLFCVCSLLTKRQHTCDKRKHKIMILTIVFPPEVGEGATASHNFIVCTNWMQIKRWWNHEKIEKEYSPLQSTVGMSIPIFTWPVSSAHRGEKIFSPSPLLGNSIAFGKESQQKSVLLDISSAQYSRLTNANKFRLNTSLTSKGLSVTYSFLSWSLEAAVFKSNILKWTKKFFFNKKVLSWSSTTLSNKTKFL
jgi:hypothetical protein